MENIFEIYFKLMKENNNSFFLFSRIFFKINIKFNELLINNCNVNIFQLIHENNERYLSKTDINIIQKINNFL